MSQDTLDTKRIVRLVLQDAIPTLGAQARAEALRLAANYEELAQEWIREGETIAKAQRSYDLYIVDGLQQAAHDLHWDTTWPTCPRHLRHPLWFDQDREAWVCRQDGSTVAALGGLAGLR